MYGYCQRTGIKKKELVNDIEVDAELKNKDINKVFAAVQKFIDSKGKQVPDQAYIEAVNLESLKEFFPTRKSGILMNLYTFQFKICKQVKFIKYQAF